MIAPIDTGRQQRVLILCFAPAIQSAAALMASDDDNSVRLPVDPRFLTPPSRLVTIGNFRGIPARERPARSVARDELKKFAEHERAPHPMDNPAKSGTAPIVKLDQESDEEVVSPDVLDGLRIMAAQGRIPHPIHNPAKPGRITSWNDTTDEEALEGNYYFKFRLNYVSSVLFCFFIHDFLLD